MPVVFAVLVIVGTLPLLSAWWAKRRTSLAHALAWAIIAWLSWAPAMLDATDAQDMPTSRYLALCLTGCAGVAVLGARRPHVFAWNFVVLGLLGVMLLPLAERHFIGTRVSEGLRVIFMSATIAVATLNYVPTRFGLAALLVLTACEIALLLEVPEIVGRVLDGMIATSPWVGWLCWRGRSRDLSEFDRTWLEFRDAWGFVWSQRVREQFNASAQNAGWPVHLDWHGLAPVKQPTTSEDEQKYLATLQAVLQRFVTADQNL
jgi:hypothetical protein